MSKAYFQSLSIETAGLLSAKAGFVLVAYHLVPVVAYPFCFTYISLKTPRPNAKLHRAPIPCRVVRKASTEHVNSQNKLRKPLADLSINTTQKKREDSEGWKRRKKPPRTLYGCLVCDILFCTRGPCWSEYLARLNTKD